MYKRTFKRTQTRFFYLNKKTGGFGFCRDESGLDAKTVEKSILSTNSPFLRFTHRKTSTGWSRRPSWLWCPWRWSRPRLRGRRHAGPVRASARRASMNDCCATRTPSPSPPPLPLPPRPHPVSVRFGVLLSLLFTFLPSISGQLVFSRCSEFSLFAADRCRKRKASRISFREGRGGGDLKMYQKCSFIFHGRWEQGCS